jgi:hypothetical protein
MKKQKQESIQEEGPLLSKWWRTPSAQAAMRRVETNKKAQLEKLREQQQAKKAALDQEIWKKNEVPKKKRKTRTPTKTPRRPRKVTRKR